MHTRATKVKRYIALDSWRGICACLVVIYHFSANSHAFESSFAKGCYLCVDFFFVLSGFVIAENYRERLLRGFPGWKFALLRLGRVYPLHIVVLALIVAHEFVKGQLENGASFSNPQFAISALPANIFLLQGLGILNRHTWNSPSWSISTEFFTYLLFASGIATLGNRLWLAEVAVVLAAPAVLALTHPNMDITTDLGLIRCALGFSVGALTFRLFERMAPNSYVQDKWMTALECAILISAITFMTIFWNSRVSILAPFLFAALIIVFAHERGAISHVMIRRPLVSIGRWSYSIYMTHALIQSILYNLAFLVAHKLKSKSPVTINTKTPGPLLEMPIWIGDALYLTMLAVVIFISYISFEKIESPANRWTRKTLGRLRPDPSQPSPSCPGPERCDVEPDVDSLQQIGKCRPTARS